MKTNYLFPYIKKINYKTLLSIVFFIFYYSAVESQVRVDFAPRASVNSPSTSVYSIKGDFVTIGNTNLTLLNYGDNTNNSSNNMVVVDVDNNPNTTNSSSSTLEFSTENGALPECSNVLFAGLYWTGRGNNLSEADMRTLKFKHSNASDYTTFTASNIIDPSTGNENIYTPGDNNMYAAFAEVTDYINEQGIGEYTAADVALSTGNGGATGYYGGWSLVVVYENSKMNWRDVTIFDGYAYVIGGTASNEISINGFNASQNGPVNIKLGFVAGEGDRGISGDYFQIRNAANTNWVDLNHNGNTTDNFFNSSIQTGGNTRSPNLLNNTGLDISMFEIPNNANNIIANGQTSTRFRYGSTADTYIIFNLAFSVDAYVPDSEGIIDLTTLNGDANPVNPYTIEPGEELTYSIDITNSGTEPIEDYVIAIPLPFSVSIVPGSISSSVNAPATSATTPYFDSATQSIIWDFGDLAMGNNSTDVLATLSFTFKVTEDCTLLTNVNCAPRIVLTQGTLSGTGAISGSTFENPFYQGYELDGICHGNPIIDPIIVDIDATDFINNNCSGDEYIVDLSICGQDNSFVQVSEIQDDLPAGTRFFNEYPVTNSSIEYSDSNPIPVNVGVNIVYAVPQNINSCYIELQIEVINITSAPTTEDVYYCVGDIANPLTANITGTNNTILLYYTDNDPNTLGQTSITPNTDTPGTTTYYVAEGVNACIGQTKTPINVIVNSPLNITSDITNITCNGESNGEIEILVTGGSGNYSYDWDYNGEELIDSDPKDLNGLSFGTYTLTVTDTSSLTCTTTESFTVTQPSNPLSISNTIKDVTCNAEANGEIIIEVSGGTEPYTYSWSNSTTNQNLTNVAAGTYSVVVTDFNGCIIEDNFTINQPNEALLANITNTTNVDCKGNTTGSITVVGSGGIPQYTYSIDAGNTEQSNGLFENLGAGNYTITITDANDCTTSVSTTITEPNLLQASISSTTDVLCSGEAAGDIEVTVVGGTPPYTYVWNNGDTTQNLNNVTAGSYTLTVTDANGCTTTTNASVAEPANPLSINISKIDANTAQGCTNGEASADVSGGTPPYTYQWSPSANNQTISNATNLPVGNHSVTITDANDCQLTQSVVIVCVNTCDAEIAIGTITNVLCVGDTTGSGTVTASSDANPNATFTFTWSNGQVDTGVTSSTLNGVTAGVYDVSVTIDGTVCQPVEETISITEPINALNLTVTSTDELGPGTSDGTASATATGGVEPYSYLWSPGGETTQNISNLPAGTYTVTVTDANGCSETATIVVNPGTCNNLSISGTSTAVSCNGESNGSVTAIISNGVGPFSYMWDSLPDTTSIVSGLPAGSYTVTVTDQTTLCTQNTTITVNEPNALSTGIAVTNILCNGDNTGTVDLTVNGGTLPYTFLWNTGATSEDIVNVAAGTYSVTITDANGCTATNQSTVLEPTEKVSGNISQITNVECLSENTGTLTALGSGGIPPYTYSINNGTTTQSSGLFENLAAGNFTILIIDANGCTFNVNATIETDDTESPEITVPTTITIEACAVTDITNLNAIFSYSSVQSGDIQSIFASNPDYNASDDFNIQSITYSDVITSTTNCPITVLRTFTITDNCANTATATQTITVQDTTPPTLTVPEDITIECTEDESSANTGEATATDTCGTVTITQNDAETASCGTTKTITRTWTATDDCGNEVSAEQTITIQDTTPPTLSVPADITIECTEDESSTNTGEATAIDTCGTVTITQNDTETPSCGTTKTITRTWTATDDCGNEVSAEQTITVQDTTPPTIDASNIENIDIQCGITPDGTLEAWILNNAGATATDSCGTLTWSNDFGSNTDVDCANGDMTVTFTAMDDCGNIATTTATYSIIDTVNPILSIPTDVVLECTEDTSPTNTGTATATDDCATPNITFSDIETVTCGITKTIVRTWIATDACGNTTSADQTITVADTTPPTFTVPEDITIQCDVDVTDLTLTGDVIDETDNCDSGLEAIYKDTVATGSCLNESIITRTWSLTDACDNTTTLVQTINVIDTTPPTFTAPADLTLECNVDANDLTITGDVIDEADNCTTDLEATYKDIITDGSCSGSYIINRKWMLVDSCNNVTSALQTIRVEDTTAPTFTAPEDITIQCDVDVTDLTLTGDVTDEEDNCDSDLEAIYTDAVATGNCLNESIITRTWSLTDACDNTTILVQTINVIDTTPPTFTAPADLTLECDVDANDLAITGDVTDEADNCTPDLEATYKDIITAGNCTGSYIIFRKWTLVDSCDNIASALQTIRVEDTTAPTFTVPEDITIECNDDATDLSLTGDVIDEADNCASDLEATYSDAITEGSCANASIITRTWSLTDECDNTTTLVQTINVMDTTAPTFTVPEDITIECDVDTTDLTITGDVTDEADNCDSDLEASYSDTVAAGSCANSSIITRTWSLTDVCNNTTTLVQTINTVDTTAPTFTVPEDITVECDIDATDLIVTGDVTDEADNCDSDLEATYSDTVAAGSCVNSSIITRTWSLTDTCDNTTTLIQTITIQDTTAPTFTVPSDIVIECDIDATDLTITGEVTDENDNCSTGLDATFTDVTVEGSCANSYTIQRTWSLEDNCDNVTTLVQTITVQDSTAPTFTVPSDMTLDCNIDVTDLSLTGDVTDEADNCSTGIEATYADIIASGSCANESIITRTWSLSDDCDNTTTLIQTITVQDNTAPTFDSDLPSDTILECDAIPAIDTITATDNCGTATVTVEETTTTGSCPNGYTLIRIWTAADDCGNETSHTQTITVQDTTAPIFNEVLPADLNAECDAIPTAETLTATDNCSTADISFEETITEGACMGDYIIERTWTATDSCGNDAVHTQIITVQDTTAPTMVTPFDENITIVCDDPIPAIPDLVFEDSCSNDISVSFNEASTQFNLLEDYEIIRTWTVTDDCGNEAQFVQTIVVEINNVITASDANFCILDIEFDLFDLLSGDFDMSGTWSVVSGNATIDGSLFDPSTADVGVYTFKYSITEGPCPTEAEVTVTLDDDCVVLACGEDDVVISKTVTANGDTINDVFEISGIEDCGFVIELQIFNRWGAEIYKNNNYQNDWGGEAHGSSVGSSGFVPTGTYYYIINLRNSGLKPFAGPIYVATNK